MRTLILRERRTRVCRLSRQDLDYLLTHHQPHLALLPTGHPKEYSVTPGGYVGTILAPTCRLVLQPKIPLANLFVLLAPNFVYPREWFRQGSENGTEALNFLAACLAERLQERGEAGLHQGYREQSNSGPFLRGRLDLAAHRRNPSQRPDVLHSIHEEWTQDIPCNQVPRSVAERLIASPWITSEVRVNLRRSLTFYEDLSLISITPDIFFRLGQDSIPPEYQDLLDLCQLLAQACEPSRADGSERSPTFLIDMERVFERYLTHILSQEAPEGTFLAQKTWVVAKAVQGQRALTMRPDLTQRGQGKICGVIDAKWKDLPRGNILRDDVYQVLAYAASLGASHAYLVYPGKRTSWVDSHLDNAGLTLGHCRLRVVGTREQMARSGQRLARKIQGGRSE